MEFRVLDLFCGAGGFSYGMDKNPHFHTVVALDFDERAAETFKKNMLETEVLVGDITDALVKSKVVSRAKNVGVNMIIGGPPCQGYSMKGKKLGLKDSRNFLFREYLNLVKELQPEVFVIENVKGLLLASNGWFKDEILKAIGDLGYMVEYGVLNAADFGVPQARERAIFICSKGRIIPLPKPTVEKFLPSELHGNQKFKTTWGRLKWDEVSPTIDTRFDASSNGTNNHPFLHRAITPREAARIQSFDDKFIFYGLKVYIRKQIGNAVPPLLAKAIADQINMAFDNE